MTTSPTLIEALRRTAADRGDDRGILYYRTLNDTEFRGYAELDQRARAIANGLTAAGCKPGDRAIVALAPGLAWADALYGVLYAGMVFVPAPTAGYGDADGLAQRLAGIARAGEAALVITDPTITAVLEGTTVDLGAPTVTLSELAETGTASAWTAPAIDDDAPAVLFFTSGSTGDPKGVIGTHRGLTATAHACEEAFQLDADATVVGWAPLHHAMGLLLQVVVPATNGGSAVLTTTEQFQRRPLSWLQLISTHRGTVTVAGNFAYALCVQFATDEQVAALDLSSLRAMVTGSEPVRPETVSAFLERFAPAGLDPRVITPALGMTEAMVVSSKPADAEFVVRPVDTARLEKGELVPAENEAATPLVSVGRPPAGVHVAIVDPDTHELAPEGTIGEIWVSSAAVSPGYFRRPDATAETFGFRLADDEHSYMRSGDLGAYLDGELYITGRLKELIILRGRNVYPQDIEAAAAALSPAFGVAAAFELENHDAPVGIIVEYDSTDLPEHHDADQLLDLVSRELVRKFSLPSIAVGLVRPGAVPRTATGKVRRQPARALAGRRQIDFLHASGFAQ